MTETEVSKDPDMLTGKLELGPEHQTRSPFKSLLLFPFQLGTSWYVEIFLRG